MDRQAPMGPPPDADAIRACALAALAALPEPFRAHLADVALWVEEEADADTLASLGLDHPLDLTGLYSGVPVGDKAGGWAGGGAIQPDRIHLYRQAILAEWVETGVRLDDLVAHVVVHEVGHHFGLSDDDIAALEAAAG